MAQERLQKVLARAGIASRRQCEALIEDGRVSVNSRVVRELGTKVDPVRDRILVDGKPIRAEKPVYLALYKPRGYVTTTSDPQNRRKVTDLIGDFPQRVYPVGRLDYDSEGLLLLTNDGDLSYKLTHPKFRVPKTYQVQVEGRPSSDVISLLRQGIELDDGPTMPADIRVLRSCIEKTLLEMTIHEGRNRLIRRMWEAVGHPVIRLKRTRIGDIRLRGMKPGSYRLLSEKEVNALRRAFRNQKH